MFGLSLLGACASHPADGTTAPANPLPPPAPPPPTPPPPPPPPSSYPLPSSVEYQRGYNLAAIHAADAFAAGGTGAGVLVGVVDTGVQQSQDDLQGAISPLSADIVTGRNQPSGVDLHATFIADIIAARYNDFGTIGVAYQSTILNVRADDPGTCTSDAKTSKCGFSDADLSRGMDYARLNGAKVINLSVGGSDPFGPQFELALQHAVNAGIIVTVAAGNNGDANADYPGQYAVDPRYAGMVIAVGASDATNALASYSNKAGSAAAGYLVAPGDNLVTTCTSSNSCWRVSGTSFAAPEVAGAAALMLQAFPNLTPQQVVHILLTTADDLGAPGVDAVYGNGLLDVARAFAPIGTMSIPMGEVAVPADSIPGSSLGAAFGDAFHRTSALTTVGLDSYQRRYQINLAGGYRTVRPMLVGDASQPQVNDARAVIASKGVTVAFSAGRSQAFLEPNSGLASLTERQDGLSDLNLQVQAGRFSFAAWRGEGGMAPNGSLQAGANAFASLTRPDQAVSAGYDFGRLRLSAEAGQGGRGLYGSWAGQQPSSYALATIGVGARRWDVSLTGGRTFEPQGPLGSFLPGATSFSMPAQTAFATVHADWAVSPGLTLSAEGGLGRTRVRSPMLDLDAPIISSNWRLTARTACGGARKDCTHFELELAQPMRVESGSFSALLAAVPTDYMDPLNFTRRSFSAAPSGREIDLRFGVDRDVPQVGWLRLQLIAAREPGNVASEPMSLGVLANWAARF
jgi:hypothetical protein